MEVLPHSDKWKKVSPHDGGRRFISLGGLSHVISSGSWYLASRARPGARFLMDVGKSKK